MANYISFDAKAISFSVNNAWTSALFATLLLSGVTLAHSRWEHEFLAWLAEHDQSIIGLGIVGIDFDDIAWSVADFPAQQAFVVSLAAHAKRTRCWEQVGLTSPDGTLEAFLDQWIAVFSSAAPSDITPRADFRWYVKPTSAGGTRRCLLHGVQLHSLCASDVQCCLVCND